MAFAIYYCQCPVCHCMPLRPQDVGETPCMVALCPAEAVGPHTHYRTDV